MGAKNRKKGAAGGGKGGSTRVKVGLKKAAKVKRRANLAEKAKLKEARASGGRRKEARRKAAEAGKDKGEAEERGKKRHKSASGASSVPGEEEVELRKGDKRFFAERDAFAAAFAGRHLPAVDAAKRAKGKRARADKGGRVSVPHAKRMRAGADREGEDDEEADEDEDGDGDEDSRDEDMDSEEEMADFERRPRSARRWGAAAAKTLLPFKMADGTLRHNEAPAPKPSGPRGGVAKAEAEKRERGKKGEENEGDSDSDNDSVYDSGEEGNGYDESSASSSSPSDDDDDDDDNADDRDGDGGVRMVAPRVAGAPRADAPGDLAARQRERVHRMRLEIAEICEEVMAAPEKNIARMMELHQMAADSDVTVQHLVLLSETRLFQDLLPDYRVRAAATKGDDDDDEAAAADEKLSKEVRRVRKYETALLAGYWRLLQYLESTARRVFRHGRKSSAKFHPRTGAVVARCLCRLLECAYNFNHRRTLVGAVVPLLQCDDASVRAMALDSVGTLFHSDAAGDASLEAVKLIAAIVKNRGARVHPEVARSFLSLPLSKDVLEWQRPAPSAAGGDASSSAAPDAAKATKKKMGKKKAYQLMRKKFLDPTLRRDMEDSSAVVNPEHRKRVQTALLTEVFTVYFRILKQASFTPVLPTVLDGLARFSGLINLDLVLDMLALLKSLASLDLPPESQLHLVVAAFKTLRVHGGSITIDLKDYYVRLYELVWEVARPENAAHVPLLLQCLHLMFQQRRQVPHERVVGFVKRLLTVAPHLPPGQAVGVYHAVRALFVAHPRARQLLDAETAAPGKFAPLEADPDHAYASAAPAWETVLPRRHFHPFVARYAASLGSESGAPVAPALLRLPPHALAERYDTSTGAFNPPLPAPSAFSKTAQKKARTQFRIGRALAKDPSNASPFLAALIASSRVRSASPLQ